MPRINTIKVVILSVLIVIGSAMSSEAGSSGFSAVATLKRFEKNLNHEFLLKRPQHSNVALRFGLTLSQV